MIFDKGFEWKMLVRPTKNRKKTLLVEPVASLIMSGHAEIAVKCHAERSRVKRGFTQTDDKPRFAAFAPFRPPKRLDGKARKPLALRRGQAATCSQCSGLLPKSAALEHCNDKKL